MCSLLLGADRVNPREPPDGAPWRFSRIDMPNVTGKYMTKITNQRTIVDRDDSPVIYC